MPTLKPDQIWLAPMEGVLDAPMRELLTAIGGYTLAVAEFVRVTDQVYPRRVFTRISPELFNGGKTQAGTPVRLQLLGQNPRAMAINAEKAVRLGSPGIDLNFGCPAPIVNRHLGGAALLEYPDHIEQIVRAVRERVPSDQQVSVKMRLGFRDRSAGYDIARRIEDAGADSLAIHARSRDDKYTPPAHWHEVARIRRALSIPLFINGEVWTPEDASNALKESGCQHILLARGAVSAPDLALRLREERPQMQWDEVVELLNRMLSLLSATRGKKLASSRLKQWLNYLKREYQEAEALFSTIRRVTLEPELLSTLRSALPHVAWQIGPSPHTAESHPPAQDSDL